MSAFHNDIFSYVTSKDVLSGVTTGILSTVSGANIGTCPKGRYLYDNGSKLYPGAYYVSTLMVGVHDPVTGLKGYIDPNSHIFTSYSQQRPAYLGDSNSGINPNPSLTQIDKADPVYTNGSIFAGGSLDLSGSAVVGQNLNVTQNIQTSNLYATNTVFGKKVYANGYSFFNNPSAVVVSPSTQHIYVSSISQNINITAPTIESIGQELNMYFQNDFLGPRNLNFANSNFYGGRTVTLNSTTANYYTARFIVLGTGSGGQNMWTLMNDSLRNYA